MRRQSEWRDLAPACPTAPRLPPCLGPRCSARALRSADGSGGDRLAGVLDPQQPVRPRPDRARASSFRCRCSPSRPETSPTGFRASPWCSSGALPDAIVVALLLVVTLHGADQLWQFLVLAAFTGTCSVGGRPSGAIADPRARADRAPHRCDLALRSIAGQVATIGGPALGGLLFALRPEAVYGVGVVLLVVSSLMLIRGRAHRSDPGVAAGDRARAFCSPASTSSARPRRSWVRSRSTSSPCSSAARSPCSRSLPSRSCTQARSGSGCSGA